MEKGVTASNKKRNPNLDLIRCIAVFCVIAVHFFKNTGYYKLPLVGGQMFFIEYMRTTFMVCVPLFLLLTGYLMNKKELNLKYYKGILHTLGIYFVTSIFCIVYQCYVLGDLLSLKYIITGILSFTANPYSWYIQMYIGLFLLIPFLNTIYNGLKSKKEKQILILTFFTLVTLSTLLGTVKINCISSWWSGIYPLMYYFIGCYLREFPPRINKILNVALLIIIYAVNAAVNVWLSGGKPFEFTDYNGWFGWENLFSSVLLFVLVNNLNLSKIPLFLSKPIQWISKLSLGIYLSSWVLDQYVYGKLQALEPVFFDELKYFPIIVMAVFLGSMIISWMADMIVKILLGTFSYAFKKISKPKNKIT